MTPKSNIGAETSGATQGSAELGEKAKQSVKNIAGSQLSNQQEKAAGGLTSVANVLRKSGEDLRGQGQESISRYASMAAERIEQLSGKLRNANFRDLVGDIEGIARREPALFLGGAFVLGLLGARFLKSSSRQSSDQGYGGNRPRPQISNRPMSYTGAGTDLSSPGQRPGYIPGQPSNPSTLGGSENWPKNQGH